VDKKKILVVDDEDSIVEVVKFQLEEKGYEVLTASDGEEGLKKAKEEMPDLIILDVIMPHMDGAAMAEALKDAPGTKEIPIIFLTSLVEEEEEKRTDHKIGGHIFIHKPFKIEELLKVIEEVLLGNL
jgi:two-component system alkaline phosphatase synthesis response regulator PhoP